MKLRELDNIQILNSEQSTCIKGGKKDDSIKPKLAVSTSDVWVQTEG